MPYQSNLPAAELALRRGVDAGLTAAGTFVAQRVRTRLLRGYTTGNFSHQMRGVAGRVMVTAPFDDNGARAISIGTSRTQVPYELYWEVGHRSVFTRRYERVEIWRPTLEASRGQVEAIIVRNIVRFTGGVGPIPVITMAFRTGGMSEAAD